LHVYSVFVKYFHWFLIYKNLYLHCARKFSLSFLSFYTFIYILLWIYLSLLFFTFKFTYLYYIHLLYCVLNSYLHFFSTYLFIYFYLKQHINNFRASSINYLAIRCTPHLYKNYYYYYLTLFFLYTHLNAMLLTPLL